jgi:arylsulfatase/arylsulfatase A
MTASPANVLLVVADSLRARNVSALGYRRETTPFLDSFASEATVYTQARSPSNWTVPSHVSLFTGYEVGEHGLDHTTELDPGHTVFEELAADHGYDTGLFSDNPFLTEHESGLDRPFEHVRGTPDSFDAAYETNGSLGDWPNGFWYADRTLEWIGEREGPWAACVNLMDTHRPYEPLAEYDRWSDDRVRGLQEAMGFKWHWEFLSGNLSLGFAKLLETIYDGAVRQVDAIFERLMAGLDEQGVLDETLVVFCGDHGEGFGEPTAHPNEPPAVSHRIGTHDVLYHVPLVVRAPGQRQGRVVHDLAGLTPFPAVVRSYATGERRVDGPGFARAELLASQAPIGPMMREEAERVCGDAEPFARHARLRYTDRPGDEVDKYAAWGEDGYRSLIRGRRESTDETPVDPEPVFEAFDARSPVEIGTPLESFTEFEGDSDTQFADELDARLEALGYK